MTEKRRRSSSPPLSTSVPRRSDIYGNGIFNYGYPTDSDNVPVLLPAPSLPSHKKLWASPATKDALRRRNIRTELVPSDPENTSALGRYLLELDEHDLDPEPLEQAPERAKPTTSKRKEHSAPGESRVVLRIPQKRWLEEIALEEATAKRTRRK